jgi:hypothetical protein
MGSDKLVGRESGILVPGHLEREPERRNGSHGTVPTAYDQDGRRRVILPKSTQKKLDQVIIELAQHGFGLVVACRADYKRADGKAPCGGFAITERDQTDPGYGCGCSRVHFQP